MTSTHAKLQARTDTIVATRLHLSLLSRDAGHLRSRTLLWVGWPAFQPCPCPALTGAWGTSRCRIWPRFLGTQSCCGNGSASLQGTPYGSLGLCGICPEGRVHWEGSITPWLTGLQTFFFLLRVDLLLLILYFCLPGAEVTGLHLHTWPDPKTYYLFI